jgi:branched-chain amino acid transport system ATP-binding protein
VSLLSLVDVHISYGGIKAVKGINLNVEQGELVCLIGANGAGKSTTLKAISGLLSPASGSIIYQNEVISGLAAHEIAKKGLRLVPEGRGMFAGLTIDENLRMGAFTRKDDIAADIERMYGLFPRLKERRTQTAGTMSGGEQQMLAIARALMSQPKLLLLDEPSMGLAPLMVEKIFEVVRDVSKSGVTILLIEQNAKLALEISSRGYVMDSGLITLADEAKALLANPKVREAYLGE